MSRKRYRPEQKIEILRELLENQTPMSELCGRYGVMLQTLYNGDSDASSTNRPIQ